MRQSAEGAVPARVSENGVGIPDDADVREASAPGLKRARTPARKRLKGKPQVRAEGGTDVTVEFPIHAEGR